MMSLVKVLTLSLIVSMIQGKVLKRVNFDAACPQGAFSSFSGDKCWLLISSPLRFIEAAQYCRTYGGELTSIHDAFDNIFLADKAEKQFTQADLYYIGGSNLRDKKNWSWVDQSPVDFMDWANYEPIDQDVNNCITVSVGHGLWHAHDCTSPAPFVCEVPQNSNLSTTMLPTTVWTTPGWNLTTAVFNVSTSMPLTTPPPNVHSTGSWNSTTHSSGNGTVVPMTTPGAVSVSVSGWSQQTSANSTFIPMTSVSLNTPTASNPAVPSSFTQGHQNNPQSPSGPTSAGAIPTLKTLLSSLAVGKAFEFFPKFDNLKHQSGQHHYSRFKSYRKM